jgi:hypothetical protein
MHPSLPLIAFAALLTCLPAAAQTRAPSPRPAGAVSPKLGVGGGDPTALAAMLAGSGVTIGNATFRGAAAAAGTFSGGQASVGIDGGVVLSTGEAVDVAGPNSDTARSTDNQQPGDTALDALVAPYQTFDAAVLEFDVTPTAATIGIRFVFGSEEYPEFVGSAYNDVLAIFVNGVNCANYNGRPVSVNTINKSVNASLFIDNDSGVRDTQMDGLTVPLDCVANVNPGVPNHVKIAIADTADSVYDAAVFLAAGGVRSPGVGAPTTSNIAKVIEYRHAEFDHYFITALPAEIQKLDDGTFAGWQRTGLAFNVFVTGTPGTAEVCRFFSTSFAPKSSHFYTPSASECDSVKKSPDWSFEATVFNVTQPGGDGGCPSGTQQLFRVYNDGQGGAPNHRYTTDHDIFVVMQQLGWKPEGYGEGVIACVPI